VCCSVCISCALNSWFCWVCSVKDGPECDVDATAAESEEGEQVVEWVASDEEL